MKKIQNFKVNSNQEFDFFFVRVASSILEGKFKISYDFVNHKYSDFCFNIIQVPTAKNYSCTGYII